jgi:RNA polymerase sigma factor (sigma-70 family)
MHQYDDTALLAKFHRQRDPAAFAELVRRYSGWVYGACVRACRDRHLAEDAAQECFLQLAKQADRINESLPGWLHTVARRIAQRLRSRQPAVLGAEFERPDDSDSSADALIRRVDDALAELPENLRAILIARFVENLDQQQLAERFSLSQPTISRRIDDALSELRRRLAHEDAACIGALSALAIAPSAELSGKLGKLSLMSSQLIAAKTALSLGAVVTTAVISLAAVGIFSFRYFDRSPASRAASEAPPVVADVVNTPVTLCVKSWPLAEVIDLLRVQMPAGRPYRIHMMPLPDDEAVPRVDLALDHAPLGEALDQAIGQTSGFWRWRRFGDAIVVDHPFKLKPTGEKTVNVNVFKVAGDLDKVAEIIRMWGKNQKDSQEPIVDNPQFDYEKELRWQRNVLRLFGSLHATFQPWLPEQSPLEVLADDRTIVDAVVRAWRRSERNHFPITPNFCHLVGTLRIRELAPDLERIMAMPYEELTGFDSPGQFQQVLAERTRQAAIWALGRMRYEPARMQMEADLLADNVPSAHAARLYALAAYADQRSRDVLAQKFFPSRPWIEGCAYYVAVSAVAPDLFTTKSADEQQALFEHGSGYWDGFIGQPLAELLPTALKAQHKAPAGYWWVREALQRGCSALPRESTLSALRSVFSTTDDPTAQTRLAIVRAELGDADGLAWLVEAVDRDDIPRREFDRAMNATLRSSPDTVDRLLQPLRARVENGEVRPSLLSLVLPVRTHKCVEAVIEAWPTLDADGRSAAVLFLLRDGSAAAMAFVADHVIPSEEMRDAANADSTLRELLVERAQQDPEIDANILLWLNHAHVAKGAADRLAALPASAVTESMVAAIGELDYSTSFLKHRNLRPQVLVLATWMRTAPHVRESAATTLGEWTAILNGETQLSALRAIQAALQDQALADVHVTLRAAIPHLLQRRGQPEGMELFEEPGIMLGDLDDPIVLAALDECASALAADMQVQPVNTGADF